MNPRITLEQVAEVANTLASKIWNRRWRSWAELIEFDADHLGNETAQPTTLTHPCFPPLSADTFRNMKLLLTGDIHIGRSSSRLPQTVRPDEIRAATTWSRIVDLALREQVAVVCLSGDIADQDNKFFEAIGPLQRGVGKLAEADILTAAVSGNHDYDVLARLADQLPAEHFRLLGRDGQWERFTFERDGRAVLYLHGWSFPAQHVRTSPLDSYAFSEDSAVPVLGLVHGDIYDAASRYGPLDRTKLQALPVNGWLLGHIHAFDLIHDPTRPWVLYPGSPQALKPGENGPHGPWIVEIDGPSFGKPEQHPLSSVWYDRFDIDLSEAADEDELEAILLNQVRERADQIVEEAGPYLTHIIFRLRLTGATAVSHAVASIANRVVQDLSLSRGDASVAVESHVVETIPAIDLDEYAATQHTAPGALARLLHNLDKPKIPPDVAELIRQARRDLDKTDTLRDFSQLAKRGITDEMARSHLKSEARSLLTQLLTKTS